MTVAFFRGLPLTLAFFSSLLSASAAAWTPNRRGHSGAKYGELANAPPYDIGLTDQNDMEYAVNIVLGGQNFTVLIDTGSTDLWVDMTGLDVQITNTTDLQTDSHYAVGDVKGNIAFAELRFGQYVIPSQAFVNATNVTSMPAGVQGLVGMAFETARIYETMEEKWGTEAANALGRGPMSNLIAQDRSVPGFFDLQLGRVSPFNDSEQHDNHLLIGQHLATASAVASAPKLERIDPYHWTIAMDGMNINGKPFTGWNKSGVAGIPPGKIAAVLDSGYSLSAWPNEVLDAVYGSIPGAVKFDGPIPGTPLPAKNNWVVPCNVSPNISFVFAGQEFFVHPFDVVVPIPQVTFTIDDITLTGNMGMCTNLFGSGDITTEFDILLGMGFLRNVYASFQYGDYTPPGMNITGQPPFVQMISVTDREAAYAEFMQLYEEKVVPGPPLIDPATYVKILKGINSLDDSLNSDSTANDSTASTPTPGSTSPAATYTSTGQNLEVAGAVAEDSSSKDSNNKYGAIALGLVGVNVVIGLIGLGLTLTLCIRSSRNKREARYKPLSLPKEDLATDAERGALYSD
ncbi:aspartic peptidase domain-containing protein [Trametes gibbosa]|nr:aspartic peptidase domain-containing protein [Trametes gibbosa]